VACHTHVNVTTAAAGPHTRPKSQDATVATVTCMSPVSWMQEHRKRSGNRGACCCPFVRWGDPSSERAPGHAPGLCRCQIRGHSVMTWPLEQGSKQRDALVSQARACTARHLRRQAASTHTTANAATTSIHANQIVQPPTSPASSNPPASRQSGAAFSGRQSSSEISLGLCLDACIGKVGEKVTSDTVAHCNTFRLFVVNIVLP